MSLMRMISNELPVTRIGWEPTKNLILRNETKIKDLIPENKITIPIQNSTKIIDFTFENLDNKLIISTNLNDSKLEIDPNDFITTNKQKIINYIQENFT